MSDVYVVWQDKATGKFADSVHEKLVEAERRVDNLVSHGFDGAFAELVDRGVASQFSYLPLPMPAMP